MKFDEKAPPPTDEWEGSTRAEKLDWWASYYAAYWTKEDDYICDEMEKKIGVTKTQAMMIMLLAQVHPITQFVKSLKISAEGLDDPPEPWKN